MKRDRERPIAIELRATDYPGPCGFNWAFVTRSGTGYPTTVTFAVGWRRDLLSMRDSLSEAVAEFRACRHHYPSSHHPSTVRQ